MENNQKKHYRSNNQNSEPQVFRVKLPKQNEVIGIIEQRLGGNRMSVACGDKMTRNCRVPGRLKRSLWLRPGDVVIVQQWEFDKDKGDILFKYNPTQIDWLKNKGYLKTEDTGF
ncbi:MAG: translation initiation factor eIF-1A [Nanoarchaeota archaeon]|nr:translation initiation factor eIF-1A [Nanoarchaeota archaeon]